MLIPPPDPTANEPPAFLPPSAPYSVAIAAARDAFGTNGLSDAVIVFERPGAKLTGDDLAAIEAFAAALPREDRINGHEPSKMTVRSPASVGGSLGDNAPNPLISRLDDGGQAALVIVSIPYNFVTSHAARIVTQTQAVLAAQGFPGGLKLAITGSAGFGRDYAAAAERSHHKTVYVTIIAVILILLLVYRSPLAPLLPLISISTAVVTTIALLAGLQHLGLHVGTAERIFVVVLLYGAGTDYSLLFISRYRENLDELVPPGDALAGGLGATMPAILASAGTNTAGLLMLYFAQFNIFKTTGPAVAVALAVALLAAITLTPALVAIAGPGMFWPGRRSRRPWKGTGAKGTGSVSASSAETVPVPVSGATQTCQSGDRHSPQREPVPLPVPVPVSPPRREPIPSSRRLPLGERAWRGIAIHVVRRPALILAVTLVLLAGPAIHGLNLNWVYDTLASLEKNPGDRIGNAAVGVEMVQHHWPVGEIAPVNIMFLAKEPRFLQRPVETSHQITAAIGSIPGVRDVRSYSQPLGKDYPLSSLTKSPAGSPDRGLLGGLIPDFGRLAKGLEAINKEYVGAGGRAMRFSVILDHPSLGLEAMETVAQLREKAQQAAASADLHAEVFITGATAEMMDTRSITQKDFTRVAVLALAVITLIILALLRDVWLSLFMVGTTILSYLATLGLASWAFTLAGAGGLDWKVQVFLFVVMVAVGQDYNIFLAARLAQEGARRPVRAATRRAIIHTGPVISSCGLIMAATLGSLMAGELGLLRQLGFAFAIGMLVDTFIVRPLLLPAFAVLIGRTGRVRQSPMTKPNDQ